MVELLRDLVFDYTIRNVALGSAILGVVGGVLGCFAVLRRQSLLGDALAHATLPGVCLAFLAAGTREPAVLLAGAAVAALAGALLIVVIVGRTRIKQDAALGIVLSTFFGLGAVLITHIGNTGNAGQSGLDRFIFGQASAIILEDVITTGVLAAVALLVTALLFKEFKLLAFDPGFAASLGYPVGRLNVLLVSLMVVAIIIGIQAVGVVLMAAMLITPAVAARQWTDRLGTMVCVSGLFGALSGVAGALISASGDNLPTGPLIVLVATAVLLLSLVFGRSQGFLWSVLRARGNRRAALRSAPPGAPGGGGAR
jgi:manganese/zinc/iron transport system permease protein